MKNLYTVAALLISLILIQTVPGQKQPKTRSAPPNTISLTSGEPEALTYDAGTVWYLATSEDTHGAWSLVELTEKPGYKTRYHRHLYTDEAYYVLEACSPPRSATRHTNFPPVLTSLSRTVRMPRGISGKFRSKSC